MVKKYLFTNINKLLFVFQFLIISCLHAQEKVVTTVIKEQNTSEPGWIWEDGQWHHSEKTTDTIPFNYQVKITTKTQKIFGGKVVNECQVADKDVTLSFETSQPGWSWNRDQRVWLYNGNIVDTSPGEYAVVLIFDIIMSECDTGKVIERVSEEHKVYFRLVDSGWKWDDLKYKWLLNGNVKVPEYCKTGAETHRRKVESKL